MVMEEKRCQIRCIKQRKIKMLLQIVQERYFVNPAQLAIAFPVANRCPGVHHTAPSGPFGVSEWTEGRGAV
jgi:hypothetical protein